MRPHPESSPDRLLRNSYRCCRRITRQAHSTFPMAFWLLPSRKRQAMHALYAFLRVTDDLADAPGDLSCKRLRLSRWRAAFLTSLSAPDPEDIRDDITCPAAQAHHGDASAGELIRERQLLPALRQTIERFQVSPEFLLAVIDGVEMDLEPGRFATFDALRVYLYRVASAVGLACLPVWGFRPGVTLDDAYAPAEAAGYAFQLTNILRDLGEDYRLGRVYLPEEDLIAFDCPPQRWGDTASFRKLLSYEIDRAREYYRQSERLIQLLSPDGRSIYSAMSRMYKDLLDEIAARGAEVLTHRVRLARWRKLRAFLSAVPARWGWR